ncbi:hypothetical protein J6590_000562 [Homalodisca vitripennis]|nr:hypothetical protein J6590_000562 [Homalodisca vitripennis]
MSNCLSETYSISHPESDIPCGSSLFQVTVGNLARNDCGRLRLSGNSPGQSQVAEDPGDRIHHTDYISLALGIMGEYPSSCLALTHPHNHKQRGLKPSRHLPFPIQNADMVGRRPAGEHARRPLPDVTRSCCQFVARISQRRDVSEVARLPKVVCWRPSQLGRPFA